MGVWVCGGENSLIWVYNRIYPLEGEWAGWERLLRKRFRPDILWMNRNWLSHIVKKSIPDKRGRQGEDCADLWRSSQFRLFLRANDHVISCDLQITSVASVGFIINLQHPTLTVYLPTWSFRFFLCNLLNGFCSLLVPPLSHDPSNLSFLYFPPIQFKFCGPHFLTCSQL